MRTPHARVGIIGGSGLYQMAEMTALASTTITTPFGEPSDAIILGNLADIPVAFLPRHGQGHRLSPSEIPARANIWALKSLGVEYVLSVSAVGSLREEIAPLDLVIPDQIFDRTRGRVASFFEGGLVAHIAFADPFCPHLSDLIATAGEASGAATIHRGGAYICIEGPQFSTRAESRVYRSWGMDIIGMTALPEAKLAREAEMHYATIACVTDYDVWHATEEAVNVDLVVGNLMRNVAHAQDIVRLVVAQLPATHSTWSCPCATALTSAVITDRARVDAATRERYALLLRRAWDV